MEHEFKTFDDFLLSFNTDPIDTLRKMNQGRQWNNKDLSKGCYSLLQKKLNEGNTLAEFFELALLRPDENIWRLINTYLSFRDVIDEAKAVYPFNSGLWKVVDSTHTYISLKDKPINNIEISETVLEKFFKIYHPLDNSKHINLTIEYENVIYNAKIIRESSGRISLNWDVEFEGILNNLYPETNFQIQKQDVLDVEYELEFRLYWHSGYTGIYACFDVRDIYIKLYEDLTDEIEISPVLVKQFFGLKKVFENEEMFRLTLTKEKDRKDFYGYLRKDKQKYHLKWDGKFISLLKEELSNLSNESKQVDSIWQLHLRRATNGRPSTWWFDLIKRNFINQPSDNILKLDIETSTNDSNSHLLNEEKQTIEEEVLINSGTFNAEKTERFIITQTEKDQVVKSRIGQSSFKNALIKVETKCRLCGVTDERFLVASHIKPWSQSNNQERLNVNNGLLLCPNHDALFDKGYISFANDGTILISNSLDEATRVFLNINETMSIRVNEEQQLYMKWHREHLFKVDII